MNRTLAGADTGRRSVRNTHERTGGTHAPPDAART